MPDPRSPPRTFQSAPPSVTSLVASFLEPGLAVATFLALAAAAGLQPDRPEMVLFLFVFALAFPAPNRFGERPLNAAVAIASSWGALVAILLVCGYATSSLELFDARLLAAWALLTPAVQWLAVFAGRNLLRWQARRPGQRRRAVVIGAGPLGAKVAQALVSPRDRGIDVLGFFDDRSGERVHADARGRRLGALAEAAPRIRELGVQQAYITLPLGSQPRIVKLLEQVQDTTASIFFVPDVFGIHIIQGRLSDVNGVPVVALCETPFTGTKALVKRLSDLLIAGALLLPLLPLMAVLAAGVKLSSPGPVIFRQRRNGLAGDEIVVYKFRTMRVAGADDAPVRQATRDDPRVTRFGAFLRRSSLDELPQLVNVLQGRMSLVGPRPHAVSHNELYRSLIKAYMVRHKVRPGITGWAQIHGYRGETDTLDKMRARVEYDLEYLRNWSLQLDLQIIARTIKLVVFDRHAY